ncbi:MAG: glutamate dehydrogenase, partial [Spongiibacteraceae bacterium]|nr:glutamate dehydrogenase [Spongiibacteraceae bacterium]
CELLVPAAMENLIHADNADRIRAGVILELANGPVTAEADQILDRKGIRVIPDILANAGGVTVSYFEWVQNRQGWHWTLDEVYARLQQVMTREAQQVWDLAQEHSVPLRTAAYIHGLKRLGAAIEAHGTQNYFNG